MSSGLSPSPTTFSTDAAPSPTIPLTTTETPLGAEWQDFSVRGSPEELTSRFEAALGSFTLSPSSRKNTRIALVAASSGAQYRITLLRPLNYHHHPAVFISSNRNQQQLALSIALGSLIAELRWGGVDNNNDDVGVDSDNGSDLDASVLLRSLYSPAEMSDRSLAFRAQNWFALNDGALLVRSAHGDSDALGSVSRSAARALLSAARLALVAAAGGVGMGGGGAQ